MKKYYLLFFYALLFTSCGYDVANNTRMEFTGTVTDQAGNPIPETFVYLEGLDHTGGSIMSPGYERSENLGENHTDHLGNFRVVSLKTSTNILHINRSEDSHFGYDEDTHEVYSEPTYNNNYTAVDYINVSGSEDFGTIKLHKKAELLFKINKTSITNDTLTWRLSYTHAVCYYIFNNGYVYEEESSCHENFADNDFQQQIPSEPIFERTYRTILGGTAEFIYHINDQPEQSILLNIDETQETYVFEY